MLVMWPGVRWSFDSALGVYFPQGCGRRASRARECPVSRKTASSAHCWAGGRRAWLYQEYYCPEHPLQGLAGAHGSQRCSCSPEMTGTAPMQPACPPGSSWLMRVGCVRLSGPSAGCSGCTRCEAPASTSKLRWKTDFGFAPPEPVCGCQSHSQWL